MIQKFEPVCNGPKLIEKLTRIKLFMLHWRYICQCKSSAKNDHEPAFHIVTNNSERKKKCFSRKIPVYPVGTDEFMYLPLRYRYLHRFVCSPTCQVSNTCTTNYFLLL